MAEDWLARWEDGRIGWHEADGNAALHRFWQGVPAGSRVLVPLCGKSPDLLWLARKGCMVTGVELSELAVREFFTGSGLDVDMEDGDDQRRFICRDPDITLVCGDYFDFDDEPFAALYDRASLIALPPQLRPAYVRHTDALLAPGAAKLLITLEYDQARVSGPPFSVLPAEVREYWPELTRLDARNDIDNCPPKFRSAGLTEVTEAVWV